MFYETTIKAITNGGAVDVNGRSLTFIGYLPVKAGDTVYTDGRFIFGNAPPKGAPAIFDVPSGIPVLGDYDSSGEDELRGYFAKNGKYKSYQIAGDDWIVNDDKNFKHDEGNNIILDAEISADGALLTVEKKVTQIAEDSKTGGVLFNHYYSTNYHPYYRQDYYSMLNFERYTRGLDTKQDYYQNWRVISPWLNNPDYVKNTTPIIKQATYISFKFTDHEFIDRDGDGIFRDCELIIKKDGDELETLKLSELVAFAETAALEYVNVTVPNYEPKDYIKSAANLLNFKIKPDGTWELLFEIEIGAERDYPRPEDSSFDDLLKYRDWLGYSTAAVHSYFIFKVDSFGITEKVVERSSFMPLYLINNVNIRAITIPFKTDGSGTTYYGARPPIVANKTTFPYEDCEIAGFHTGAVTIDGTEWEGEEWWTTYTVWDSRLMQNAPDYDNDLEEFADFDFPVQDDYRANIRFENFDYNIITLMYNAVCRLLGVVDADNKQIIGTLETDETDAHKWNMSLATLKGGGCLFGIRKDDDREIDGALYKIDDKGTVEQVGDGLKNFRLRELKKISKAKK